MAYNKDYALYYDYFNQGKSYHKEVDFLEEAFRKCSKNKIKIILDLGCGTGLHTSELVQRNFTVTGLDLSEEMIALAKQRNPSSEFYQGDMSHFNLNKKFDAIITMFSAMGYLTENTQLEGFFRSAKDHLSKGGLLILDIWNGLGVMHELPTSREKIAELADKNIKIIRTSYPALDAKNHINNVKFAVKVFELSSNRLITEYEENHKVRFFFPQEIKKYMEDAGFQLVHVCPSFNLNEELSYLHWNMVLVGMAK